jgi:hypothetical protein
LWISFGDYLLDWSKTLISVLAVIGTSPLAVCFSPPGNLAHVGQVGSKWLVDPMESSNNSFLWPTVDRRDVATKAVLPVSNSKDHCNTRFLLRTSAESRGMPTACCFINTPARFVLKAFGPHFLSNIWAGPSDRKTIEAGPSVGKTCRPNAGKTSVGPTPKKQMWAQCRKKNAGTILEIHIQSSRVLAQVLKRKYVAGMLLKEWPVAQSL